MTSNLLSETWKRLIARLSPSQTETVTRHLHQVSNIADSEGRLLLLLTGDAEFSAELASIFFKNAIALGFGGIHWQSSGDENDYFTIIRPISTESHA